MAEPTYYNPTWQASVSALCGVGKHDVCSNEDCKCPHHAVQPPEMIEGE